MRIVAELTDATHLRLELPLSLPPGTRFVVDLNPLDAERQEFMRASSALLERAYGDDEPDYSDAGVPVIHKD